MKVTQRWPTWVRRLAFAAVLILAAATPGMAATWTSSQCQHSGCERAGTVRWIRPLPGSWTVQNGITGTTLARVNAASSSGLYGVREGAVLGIDHGGLGKAWAYDIAAQRVLWTSRPLPWPHYFVDLSGIGGSAPPGEDGVLLAVCGKVGPQPSGTAPPPCARPELAVVNR